jgi:hypothetical protein
MKKKQITTTKLRAAAVEDNELLARAFSAWFRYCRKTGSLPDFPGNDSGVEEDHGHQYVILRNVRGIMAVYRVRNDGILKSLKRWPARWAKE